MLVERLRLRRVALDMELDRDDAAGREPSLVDDVRPLVGVARMEPAPGEDVAAQRPAARRAEVLPAAVLAVVHEPRIRVVIHEEPLLESVGHVVLLECHVERDRGVVERRDSVVTVGTKLDPKGGIELRGLEQSREHGAGQSAAARRAATAATAATTACRMLGSGSTCSDWIGMAAAPTSGKGGVVVVVGRVPV